METKPASTAISTEKAPRAIGPYSQAIQSGSTLFTSGQLGMDPATGELVTGGIEAETRQVLENPQLRREMVDLNYKIAAHCFSYAVLRQKLKPIIFDCISCRPRRLAADRTVSSVQ